MKDKTLYWILGIIAAYFIIRFLVGKYQDKQTANNTGHKEGDEGPVCKVCGSKTYYKKVLSGAEPGKYVLKAICSNPDCESHQLLY